MNLFFSLLRLAFRKNFHCVLPKRVYRSGALRPGELVATLRRYEIKSVIDLRKNPDRTGRHEREIVEKQGVAYYTIGLNARKLPHRKKLEQILNVLDIAPTPVLIHCSSGTHRTGVFTAIWLLEREKLPFYIAKKQLALRFGYFRPERLWKTWFSVFPTVDNVLWHYRRALKQHGLSFREWVSSL